MMQMIKQFLKTLIVIFSVLSISISLVILLGGSIYRVYHHFDILADKVGLTKEVLFYNIDQMMCYLIVPGSDTLSFPNFSSSASGIQHFMEVKHLMQSNFLLSIFGVVLLMLFKMKHQNKSVRWHFYQWIGLAYYAPIVLLTFIIIAFDKVFIWFHELFFNNDLWLFNPVTDPIINVLPQNLFMVYFILAIVIYELLIFIYRKMIIY